MKRERERERESSCSSCVSRRKRRPKEEEGFTMATSAIFILDMKGKVIIYRDYRGDVPISYADRFIEKVAELEDAGKASPIIQDEGVTYLYLQHSNVYLLAVTKSNVNAASTVYFLHKLIDVSGSFFPPSSSSRQFSSFFLLYWPTTNRTLLFSSDFADLC